MDGGGVTLAVAGAVVLLIAHAAFDAGPRQRRYQIVEQQYLRAVPTIPHTHEYNRARVTRPFHELIEANLRREAYVRGVTLDEIARASGISMERLLAIFSGDWSPDLQLVGRIAESVGLTAAELLTEPDVN